MPQDTQPEPEFAWPAILRLPQVPPLKVPARRQTQFIAPPAPVRYTEQAPATPSFAPENDPFMPLPVTPPLTHQPQLRMRAPDLVNIGGITVTGRPVRRYIPTGRRSREVGNGEFLLGCAFLFFMALLALGLLTWLSAVR